MAISSRLYNIISRESQELSINEVKPNRFMRKILYQGCGLLLFLCTTKITFSQVSISGPTCAVAGMAYEYTISGRWDSSSTMQVCVNNGLIQDSSGSNSCSLSRKPVNVILVMWNDSTSDIGNVSITSSAGNASFNVNFTQPLLPGIIDSASKTQVIRYSAVPATITCSSDSGAACSPVYNYQWQQSDDQVSWQDISDANNISLHLDSPLIQSTYYRRKVTETLSGSIGYSDVASVFVVIMPDSTGNSPASGQGSSGLNFKIIIKSNVISGYDERNIKYWPIYTFTRKETKICQVINKYNNKA
jgi:hypothetical protein